MPSFWTRLSLAFRAFTTVLSEGKLPEEPSEEAAGKKLAPHNLPATQAPKSTTEEIGQAVQILALLQRDGRLIDFLWEDVAPYSDQQLGAAVRSVHESCRQVLDRYISLEPVLDSEEDQPVTISRGFDASAIKLIGNVTGEPPIRGLLRHCGWRVKQANLPPLPEGAARLVVAPAEVEVP